LLGLDGTELCSLLSISSKGNGFRELDPACRKAIFKMGGKGYA
jgi:hypothetical protein